ncbi:MAG: hypothetical protein KAK00_10065 [Nanoarchaeota archaeon]|nr:hypothetical protein [Nanoarchaeota archaeon]
MKHVIKAFIIILIILCTACQQKNNIPQPVESGKEIEVYFCPKDNCENELIKRINNAKLSVHCAFFDIDLKNLINTLNRKSKIIDVRLVIDSDNYFNQTKEIPYILDDKNQLSHNKFCIIDQKIITTGSFNPTDNGNNKNNNNLIITNSKFLAENYEDEFRELWNKEFGSGKKVNHPKIIYNNNMIENYFCPEGSCSEHLINELINAKNSIYFMLFSFTDESVADAILYSEVKDIRGVFEKFQAGGKYSQYKRLEEFGLDVIVDDNPKFMHHKVFIIDNNTVITGSYNPTSAGDNKNDENMLIIHDRKVAKRFLEEFDMLVYGK